MGLSSSSNVNHPQYIDRLWSDYKQSTDDNVKKLKLHRILESLHNRHQTMTVDQTKNIIDKISSLDNKELKYIKCFSVGYGDKQSHHTFIMILSVIYEHRVFKDLKSNIVKLMLYLIENDCNYPEYICGSYCYPYRQMNELHTVTINHELENVALALHQQNKSDYSVNGGTLLLTAYNNNMRTLASKLIEDKKCSMLAEGYFMHNYHHYYDTSLLVCACLHNDEKLCLELLKLENKPDPRSLSIACANRMTNVILEMIKSKKYNTELPMYDTVFTYLHSDDGKGYTLLFLLCKNNMETEVLELLKNPLGIEYAFADSRDKKTALYYAIENNMKKVISILSTPEQLDNLMRYNGYAIIRDLLRISCLSSNIEMITILTKKYRFDEKYMQEMYEICSPEIQKLFPYPHTIGDLISEIAQLKKQINTLQTLAESAKSQIPSESPVVS